MTLLERARALARYWTTGGRHYVLWEISVSSPMVAAHLGAAITRELGPILGPTFVVALAEAAA